MVHLFMAVIVIIDSDRGRSDQKKNQERTGKTGESVGNELTDVLSEWIMHL